VGRESSRNERQNDVIELHEAPAIPGLRFRRFRGEIDYPAMAAVFNGCKEVDELEHTESADEIAITYRHLVNSDPYLDMIFAEMPGAVIGYGRVWWEQKTDGSRSYCQFALLLPEWRKRGIRRAMLRHNEQRLRQIAATHPTDSPQFLDAWAGQAESDWESLLLETGYKPIRYSFQMVRPALEDIPDLSIPEGLKIRPTRPDDYRAIWNAAREAFQNHWGASEWREETFQQWQEQPTFNPKLWQVAWDGDEVAGMVLNFINERENEEYKRKRGYTETICVRRPWRRQGLARALLARSLRVLKEEGMTEAALSVDAENISGAVRLYEGLGYEVVKRYTRYRKSLD